MISGGQRQERGDEACLRRSGGSETITAGLCRTEPSPLAEMGDEERYSELIGEAHLQVAIGIQEKVTGFEIACSWAGSESKM